MKAIGLALALLLSAACGGADLAVECDVRYQGSSLPETDPPRDAWVQINVDVGDDCEGALGDLSIDVDGVDRSVRCDTNAPTTAITQMPLEYPGSHGAVVEFAGRMCAFDVPAENGGHMNVYVTMGE